MVAMRTLAQKQNQAQRSAPVMPPATHAGNIQSPFHSAAGAALGHDFGRIRVLAGADVELRRAPAPRRPKSAGKKKAAAKKEDRATLRRMVEEPDFAHKRWKKTSSSGRKAVLEAMRKRYGEDWADEFLARQESGAVNPRFLPWGVAPGMESLEDDGFALAASFMLTTESRFEVWVHPDGSLARGVRQIGEKKLPEAPPVELPAEEVMDLSPEEVREWPGFPFGIGKIERIELIDEQEDGSRTFKIRTPTTIVIATLGPDDEPRSFQISSREAE
jgi:hypothetical protein